MTAEPTRGRAAALDALRHLKRPRTQRHDPVTTAFLDAGLELFDEVFSPDSGPASPGQVPTVKPLAWLQISLVERRAAQRADDGRATAPTRGALYERWPSKDHFIADLLAYAIASTRWDTHVDEAVAHGVPGDQLPNPSVLIGAVLAADFAFAQQSSPWRIEQHLGPVSGAYPQVAATLRQTYGEITDAWAAVYEQLLGGYGFRLRDGMTYRDLAVILTAVMDGFLIRAEIDPDEVGAAGEPGSTRQTLACAAIFAACAVPIDSDDHRTVPESLDALAAGPESTGA
jgi:AcrR family transcriptional regulator